MLNRREWLAAWTAIAAAARSAPAQAKLTFFTPAEAREVEAIAEQIIPGGSTPGARDTGVVTFIDRALPSLSAETRALYRNSLAALGPFSTLAPDAQTSKLKSIETTPFFQAVRTHTIMGFLADPKYGGNRDRAGWKLIGFSDAHVYRPPFGHYDKEA